MKKTLNVSGVLVFFGIIFNFLGMVLAQTQDSEGRIIHVDVVALDNPVFYNRFGSVNPYSMIYALERDVVRVERGEEWLPGLDCVSEWRLREGKRPRPLVLRGNVGDTLQITFTNRLLPKQPDLSDDCRLIDEESPYSNLLNPEKFEEGERTDEGETHNKDKRTNDWPTTRTASIVIPSLTAEDGTDVVCTGVVPVEPGESVTCSWKLEREGSHLFYSHGAPAGGEGDGGSLVQGLFGALNVEPKGSQWYRAQVNASDLDIAWPRKDYTGARSGPLYYEAEYLIADNDRAIEPNDPILNMLKHIGGNHYELIYGDLNAIIWESEPQRADFNKLYDDPREAKGRYEEALHFYEESPAFREFTAIFHDELKTFYANQFTELEKEFQLSGVRDGFGINYGASGMGSILIANRKGIGPSWNCVECFYEEFFLQSWANGDPALLEEYFDDPSNVFHSYLNDRVKYRNLHAGPKETHVFHLHAHQWLSASDEDKGSYLDSQTIGPMQGFEYEIYHGGLRHYGDDHSGGNEPHPPTEDHHTDEHHHTQSSGNRNRTPGDSIFHCHLYPHFAQGMWALWRVHDVLEDGTRTLPDGQPYAGWSFDIINKTSQPRLGTDPLTGVNRGGTPIPAIVPLPSQALPLLPTYGELGMAGYPFYVAGKAGHRAPQPPLDFAKDDDDNWLDASLPRHIFNGGERGFSGLSANEVKDILEERNFSGVTQSEILEITNGVDLDVSQLSVAQVQALGGKKLLKRALALGDFSVELESADIEILDNEGTVIERAAMNFHAGISMIDVDNDGVEEQLQLSMANGETVKFTPNIGYSSFDPEDSNAYVTTTPADSSKEEKSLIFTVNGASPQPGAPFADPCYDPAHKKDRNYYVSAITLDMIVNKAGWHDPQARINVLNSDVERFEGIHTNEAEPFFFRTHSRDCINFYHTNRTPKDLELDDFQVKTPTDIIGQHIHLVKFDVTSS